MLMAVKDDDSYVDLLDENDDENSKLDFSDNAIESAIDKKTEQRKNAQHRNMIRQKIDLYKEQLQLRKDTDPLSYYWD